MTLESVTGAVALLRQPVIWSIGLAIGGFLLATAIITISGETFYMEPLMLLLGLALPFLAGGIYGTIRAENFSFSEFVQSGKTYYFRILLPTLVIFFAVILTIILLTIPLALLGAGAAANMAALLFGVILSIAFFTFFYDTVAVFEETGVFESIRRSIEFVMNNLGRVLVFYLVNIVVSLVFWFAGSFVWTALLIDKLEPLVNMSPDELQALMPEDIIALIGTEGMTIIAIVYAVVFVVFFAFMFAYKASFFRNHVGAVQAEQGEYDEKGRWYKY